MIERRFLLGPADARAIVANPTPDQSPFLRKLAWISLKQAQGTCVIQSRLPPTPPNGPRAA